MKIGVISTIGGLYSWAGSEEMWYGLAMSSLSEGHALYIHAADKITHSSQALKLKERGVRFYPRTELSAITQRFARRGYYSRFRKFFDEDLDVLCISMGGIADCVWMPDLLKAVFHSRLPLIVIVQANAEGIVTGEKHRELLRQFYQRATSVVFVSEHNRLLAERQLGVHLPDAHVILNPLRDPVEHALPWPETSDGVVRFAEVARLEVADKQQDHLLEALSSPAWKARKWRLTFYGSGDDEAYIRRLIVFYGLGDKVGIGGFVDDFRDIWKSNHLHILPSRREGMPLSLIESMACGRPALVTRAGGSPELVEEGVNGFVCPGMHPEVLRETLETAWESRDRWREMGMAAHQKMSTLVHDDWAANLLGIVKESVHNMRL